MRKKYIERNLRNEIGTDIKFVEDENGNIIPSYKMRKGMNYICPICKIKMIRYERGNTIYCARKAGTHHQNPICRLSERGGEKRKLPVDKSAYDFIMYLVRAKMKKGLGKGPGKGPGPGSKPGPKPPIERELIISSLKHIADSDILLSDPNEMYGEYRFIDLILPYWYAQKFFKDRPQIDLGPRILLCELDFYDDKSAPYKLIFSMYRYDKVEKKRVFQVKFCVNFQDKKDFREQLKRVCKFEMNPNTGKMETHVLLALVAGIDWELVPHEKCLACCSKHKRNCEGCCGMFETEFSSEKQIYAWDGK